jgi:hypothetical protein
MATIDVPRFPIISWKISVAAEYVITVTRNLVVKTVKFADIYKNIQTGRYEFYGYGEDDGLYLSKAIAEALQHVLTEDGTTTDRLPSGGFNLPAYSVIGTYTDGDSGKSFPTIRQQVIASPTFPLAISVNFGSEAKRFGFIDSGTVTWGIPPVGLSTTFRADYPPDGLFAPNNYIVYEDRNFERDTVVNSAAFDNRVFSTVNWSTNRQTMVLSYPAVGAEFIYLYRREDSRFSVYTNPNDPNNLLQNLYMEAQLGTIFRIYWNEDEVSPEAIDNFEEFTIQSPEALTRFESLVSDVSARGRLFDVTIPFIAYAE